MSPAGKPLPVVRVVAALWRRDGRVFLAQRPEGKHHAGLWELPGGKQELGERAAVALAREAREELGVAWAVGPEWAQTEERSAARRVVMRIFQVSGSAQPQGLEGQKIGWFTADELEDLPMPPMDGGLRKRLQAELRAPATALWQQSFAWVHGIGVRMEQALWRAGIADHQGFLSYFEEHPALDGVLGREQVVRLRQALAADAGRDRSTRWAEVAARPRWRLLEAWSDVTAALGFECDATGTPTVMGVAESPEDFCAYMAEPMVQRWLERASELLPGRWTPTGPTTGILDGRPLRLAAFEEAPQAIRSDGMLLVFGGRKFDVAMMRKVYDGLPIPERVADLLDLARRARLRGGLKAVERRLGLRRPERIADLRGRDAITLWGRAQADDAQGLWAMADLLAYNRADTVNLFAVREGLLLAVAERLALPDWYRRFEALEAR